MGRMGIRLSRVLAGVKEVLVQAVRRDFYENRSKCDKSMKLGIKLYYTIVNQKRQGHT